MGLHLCYVLVSMTGATILRDARVHAGLSRRALAAKAEVPTSTVSRIEDGLSDPTVSMLERLVAAAGVQLLIDIEPADATPTLAALATAVETDNGRLKIDWTRLRGFADWAAQHPELLASAIADPPARTGTPLDAILAAFAEQLAVECHLDRPRWTRAVGPLADQWSPPLTPAMRSKAAAATPEPFRRRNLILSKSALFRPVA
jgi:transcriptional regulator with XRE-family HTH domain